MDTDKDNLVPWYKNKIAVRIINQEGKCAAGHKVGDEFIIDGHVPTGMCSWAFCTIFPFATVLQSGGDFHWEPDKDKTTVACPDHINTVMFELKRIR